MAEDLQNLLDRIQKDGVDKAEAEAKDIVSKAQNDAAGIVKEAEAKRDALIKEAEAEGQVFADRGRTALQQAARDIVLSVSEALSSTLHKIVSDRLSEAMTIDVLKDVLVKVVDAYCTGSDGVDLLVSEEQRQQVIDFFMQEYREAISRGLTIHGSGTIASGFQISMADGHVSHDFTTEAIADAMSRILRPHLAEITREALAGAADKPGQDG